MAYRNNVPQAKQTNLAQNAGKIEDWLRSPKVQEKFKEVLDKSAGAFTTSILSLTKQTPALAVCDVKTIMSAAMTAATLKLPINPNLGFAYIIPYKNRNGSEAQFQMGYKGYIQLAMRSGQYKTINAAPVYEGQIEDVDFITGEITRGKKISNEVVGYVSYFRLVNGFEKTLYMTKEEVKTHADTYSKSYGYDKKFGKKSSVWSTNFNAMATKTVLKQLISKYGIMSVDMQSSDLAYALERDGAVMDINGNPKYQDNPERNITPPEELQDFDETMPLEAEQPKQEVPQAPAKETIPVEKTAEAPAADFPVEPPF